MLACAVSSGSILLLSLSSYAENFTLLSYAKNKLTCWPANLLGCSWPTVPAVS